MEDYPPDFVRGGPPNRPVGSSLTAGHGSSLTGGLSSGLSGGMGGSSLGNGVSRLRGTSDLRVSYEDYQRLQDEMNKLRRYKREVKEWEQKCNLEKNFTRQWKKENQRLKEELARVREENDELAEKLEIVEEKLDVVEEQLQHAGSKDGTGRKDISEKDVEGAGGSGVGIDSTAASGGGVTPAKSDLNKGCEGSETVDPIPATRKSTIRKSGAEKNLDDAFSNATNTTPGAGGGKPPLSSPPDPTTGRASSSVKRGRLSSKGFSSSTKRDVDLNSDPIVPDEKTQESLEELKKALGEREREIREKEREVEEKQRQMEREIEKLEQLRKEARGSSDMKTVTISDSRISTEITTSNEGIENGTSGTKTNPNGTTTIDYAALNPAKGGGKDGGKGVVNNLNKGPSLNKGIINLNKGPRVNKGEGKGAPPIPAKGKGKELGKRNTMYQTSPSDGNGPNNNGKSNGLVNLYWRPALQATEEMILDGPDKFLENFVRYNPDLRVKCEGVPNKLEFMGSKRNAWHSRTDPPSVRDSSVKDPIKDQPKDSPNESSSTTLLVPEGRPTNESVRKDSMLGKDSMLDRSAFSDNDTLDKSTIINHFVGKDSFVSKDSFVGKDSFEALNNPLPPGGGGPRPGGGGPGGRSSAGCKRRRTIYSLETNSHVMELPDDILNEYFTKKRATVDMGRILAGGAGSSSLVSAAGRRGTLAADGLGDNKLPNVLLDGKRIRMLEILLQRQKMRTNLTGMASIEAIKHAFLSCDYHIVPLDHLVIVRSAHRAHLELDEPIKKFVADFGSARLQDLESPYCHILVHEVCCKIPQLDERLECMIFSYNFDSLYETCFKKLGVCYNGLRTIYQRREFCAYFFQTAKKLGNKLNRGSNVFTFEDAAVPGSYNGSGGTPIRRPQGFELASLEKLGQTKSSAEPRATLYHFVLSIMNVCDANQIFSDGEIKKLESAKTVRAIGVFDLCEGLFTNLAEIENIVLKGEYRNRETNVKTTIDRRRMTMAPEIVDREDKFYETMQKFSQRARRKAHQIAVYSWNVFSTYKELCIFFDDIGSLWPLKEDRRDLFQIMNDFAVSVKKAFEDINGRIINGGRNFKSGMILDNKGIIASTSNSATSNSSFLPSSNSFLPNSQKDNNNNNGNGGMTTNNGKEGKLASLKEKILRRIAEEQGGRPVSPFRKGRDNERRSRKSHTGQRSSGHTSTQPSPIDGLPLKGTRESKDGKEFQNNRSSGSNSMRISNVAGTTSRASPVSIDIQSGLITSKTITPKRMFTEDIPPVKPVSPRTHRESTLKNALNKRDSIGMGRPSDVVKTRESDVDGRNGSTTSSARARETAQFARETAQFPRADTGLNKDSTNTYTGFNGPTKFSNADRFNVNRSSANRSVSEVPFVPPNRRSEKKKSFDEEEWDEDDSEGERREQILKANAKRERNSMLEKHSIKDPTLEIDKRNTILRAARSQSRNSAQPGYILEDVSGRTGKGSANDSEQRIDSSKERDRHKNRSKEDRSRGEDRSKADRSKNQDRSKCRKDESGGAGSASGSTSTSPLDTVPNNSSDGTSPQDPNAVVTAQEPSPTDSMNSNSFRSANSNSVSISTNPRISTADGPDARDSSGNIRQRAKTSVKKKSGRSVTPRRIPRDIGLISEKHIVLEERDSRDMRGDKGRDGRQDGTRDNQKKGDIERVDPKNQTWSKESSLSKEMQKERDLEKQRLNATSKDRILNRISASPPTVTREGGPLISPADSIGNPNSTLNLSKDKSALSKDRRRKNVTPRDGGVNGTALRDNKPPPGSTSVPVPSPVVPRSIIQTLPTSDEKPKEDRLKPSHHRGTYPRDGPSGSSRDSQPPKRRDSKEPQSLKERDSLRERAKDPPKEFTRANQEFICPPQAVGSSPTEHLRESPTESQTRGSPTESQHSQSGIQRRSPRSNITRMSPRTANEGGPRVYPPANDKYRSKDDSLGPRERGGSGAGGSNHSVHIGTSTSQTRPPIGKDRDSMRAQNNHSSRDGGSARNSVRDDGRGNVNERRSTRETETYSAREPQSSTNMPPRDSKRDGSMRPPTGKKTSPTLTGSSNSSVSGQIRRDVRGVSPQLGISKINLLSGGNSARGSASSAANSTRGISPSIRQPSPNAIRAGEVRGPTPPRPLRTTPDEIQAPPLQNFPEMFSKHSTISSGSGSARGSAGSNAGADEGFNSGACSSGVGSSTIRGRGNSGSVIRNYATSEAAPRTNANGSIPPAQLLAGGPPRRAPAGRSSNTGIKNNPLNGSGGLGALKNRNFNAHISHGMGRGNSGGPPGNNPGGPLGNSNNSHANLHTSGSGSNKESTHQRPMGGTGSSITFPSGSSFPPPPTRKAGRKSLRGYCDAQEREVLSQLFEEDENLLSDDSGPDKSRASNADHPNNGGQNTVNGFNSTANRFNNSSNGSLLTGLLGSSRNGFNGMSSSTSTNSGGFDSSNNMKNGNGSTTSNVPPNNHQGSNVPNLGGSNGVSNRNVMNSSGLNNTSGKSNIVAMQPRTNNVQPMHMRRNPGLSPIQSPGSSPPPTSQNRYAKTNGLLTGIGSSISGSNVPNISVMPSGAPQRGIDQRGGSVSPMPGGAPQRGIDQRGGSVSPMPGSQDPNGSPMPGGPQGHGNGPLGNGVGSMSPMPNNLTSSTHSTHATHSTQGGIISPLRNHQRAAFCTTDSPIPNEFTPLKSGELAYVKPERQERANRYHQEYLKREHEKQVKKQQMQASMNRGGTMTQQPLLQAQLKEQKQRIELKQTYSYMRE